MIYVERQVVKRTNPLGPVMAVVMVVCAVAALSMAGPLLALLFIGAAPVFLFIKEDA